MQRYGSLLGIIQLDNFGTLLIHVLPFNILMQFLVMPPRFIVHSLCGFSHLHDLGYLLFRLSLDNDIKYRFILEITSQHNGQSVTDPYIP